MARLDLSNLLAGLLVIAIGLYFGIGALDYRMGTAVRMGPGFLPMALSVIAVGLGLAIALTALGRRGAPLALAWRPFLLVIASLGVFGLLLPRAGLMPAAVAAVLISTAAMPVLRPATRLLLAAAVALMAWVVFVLMLGMTLPVLRNPLS